jgi:hypothetical protein
MKVCGTRAQTQKDDRNMKNEVIVSHIIYFSFMTDDCELHTDHKKKLHNKTIKKHMQYDYDFVNNI